MVSWSVPVQNGASMNRINIQVREMDGLVRRHLEPIAGASGYVHSCFERTINLKINGKLITMHPNGPVGPMNCLVGENDFHELSQRCLPGMGVAGGSSPSCPRLAITDIQGQTVIRLTLDKSIVSPPCRVPPFPGRGDSVSGMYRAVGDHLERAGGISIFAPAPPPGPVGAPARLLHRRARNIFRGVRHAFGISDPQFLQRQLQAAVALGPGLTPAGDDFCYGLLASERSLALSGRSRFSLFQIRDLTRRIATRARAESTEFSASFLEQLSEGYVFPVVRAVLESAVAGERSIQAALEGLSGCGHSSGYDMLAGIHLSLGMSGDRNIAFPGPITIQAGGHNNANT